ncbi:MAG: tRNA (N(6)-L-threonylcarbamoyladenosine(37)-C(2))-methylthiotransferase MtaB [Acholeplasmatales bacterium]|nr:tRNA (N(6)-L-threonylcarbamoyladenosine(37)-C(2))-methylthiotransferase MtaB [Acholeplasmatales bacterium]
MKVGFITLGCKVNIYESNALKEEFQRRGFEVLDAEDDCDIYVINTCSVTNMADSKSRKMIRRCIKMNPNAIICAIGCYIQTNDDAKEIEGVDILVGNGNKASIVDKVVDLVNRGVKEKNIDILDILNISEYEALGVTTYDHTRAFVKIEDGCNQFCAYCIIPFARGNVRCKDSDSVIEELKNITEKGYKEVVLAGIHTGRYKDKEKNVNLSRLVRRILNEVPKLKRLRLSSIEINEIDDDFIQMMKESEILANHLHLPLQAGSNKTLKNMGRPYDLSYFKEKIDKIRSVRPDISISTDIIVGFPYETDEDFKETMEFSKEIGFSKIHVFPYSKRKGTRAAEMPQVNDKVKKDRALELIALSDKLEEEYAKKFVGQKLDIIVEQKYSKDKMIGHSSNFLQIVLDLDENMIKKQVDVVVDKVENKMVFGHIIKN